MEKDNLDRNHINKKEMNESKILLEQIITIYNSDTINYIHQLFQFSAYLNDQLIDSRDVYVLVVIVEYLKKEKLEFC